MKIIAWNINGIRASMKNGDLYSLIDSEKPHIICLGETKLSCPIEAVSDELDKKLSQYKYKYYSTCSIKKGYSGTAIFSKKKPLNITYGLDTIDNEGRVITIEFKSFYLVHVYTPNAGEELKRLKFRTDTWDIKFKTHLDILQRHKPLVICGDLNVANEPIDIHDPKHNKNSAGYTIQERDSFKNILSSLSLIDTFRYLHPEEIKYTYWSYRNQAKKHNKGWRIDYFLVSNSIKKKIKQSDILIDISGSDHAPIYLNI